MKNIKLFTALTVTLVVGGLSLNHVFAAESTTTEQPQTIVEVIRDEVQTEAETNTETGETTSWHGNHRYEDCDQYHNDGETSTRRGDCHNANQERSEGWHGNHSTEDCNQYHGQQNNSGRHHRRNR